MAHKVYLNAHNTVTITCPQCNKTDIVNVEHYLHIHRPITVNCPCGHRFAVILEGRKFYRKDAGLPGTYTSLETSQTGRLVIETLSFSGIGFRTLTPHVIHIDDMLQLAFILDDAQRTSMDKRAIVRWVHGQHIGAEFSDIKAYDKTLGAYLMPG